MLLRPFTWTLALLVGWSLVYSPQASAQTALPTTIIQTTSAASAPQRPPTSSVGWTLEAVGGVLLGAGFVSLALGYASIVRRDQLVSQAEQGKDIDATEVKSFDDAGNILVPVGYIVGGIGAATMIVGAIMIVAHAPAKEPNIKQTVSPTPSVLGTPITSQTLFQTH
ncbi:MAG: hypothetical protein CL920_15285 [Deltaproteobacteria bacterium]|nr:hypothetical protein [Deltaproteobacteria bacterium]|tara:strand:- start:1413 stop:1913 length:501 start_codon:yes stop_codon:yes gene_type:complete